MIGRRMVVVTVALCLGSARVGAAQALPYAVPVVDWDPEPFLLQQRSYVANAGEFEVLFCVESWRKLPIAGGVERYVIERVRRERPGVSHHVPDVGSLCRGRDGTPLPMLHTHSDGNCQFSPADLIVLVARGAPFAGVQCGERHFVWQFAWEVLAIATSVERAQRSGDSAIALRPDL